MSFTSNLLINPGFESSLTGWTTFSSDAVNSAWTAPTSPTPHGGTRFAQFATSVADVFGYIEQTVNVSAYATEIDVGNTTLQSSVFYGASTASAKSQIFIRFYDALSAAIGGYDAEISSSPGFSWSLNFIENVLVPVGTRSININLQWEIYASLQGGGFDDTTLTLGLNEATLPGPNQLIPMCDSLGF